MKVLREIQCLCPSCMENHKVLIVELEETNIFKGEQVNYMVQYHYCENTEEYYESGEQISQNYISMKNSYLTKHNY